MYMIFPSNGQVYAVCPFCKNIVDGRRGAPTPESRIRIPENEPNRKVKLPSDPIDWKCPSCEAWVRDEDEDDAPDTENE